MANTLSSEFRKRKAVATNTIYYDCKKLLLKIHGPDPDENFKLAQSMVLVGAPSTAARRLAQLICRKPKPFDGCSCATAVGSIWRDMLPSAVRAQIASMDLETQLRSFSYLRKYIATCTIAIYLLK